MAKQEEYYDIRNFLVPYDGLLYLSRITVMAMIAMLFLWFLYIL